nr:MAG TPA: peptidase [Caudoviricetes sp.]
MSKYFTLEELTRSQTAARLGYDNIPNATQKRDLLRLMDYLDGIREEFREAIKVTSGFRSWDVNHAVGGVKKSQHLAGQAADIVPAKSPERLRELFDIIRKRGGYQQVIYERKGQSVWVHVAIPPLGEMPKQEAMTTNDGKNFTRLK